MLRDLKSNLTVSSLLIPATRTADANSSSADLQDAIAAEVVVHLGDSGDTLSGSVYLLLELEHSDDNSTWSDCADADIDTAVTGTNTGTFAVVDAPSEDSTVFKCGYKGSKRYIRAVINFVGTHTNGIPCGVAAILAPKHLSAA